MDHLRFFEDCIQFFEKRDQRVQIYSTVIENQAHRQGVANADLFLAVFSDKNTKFFLDRTQTYGENLRGHDLEQTEVSSLFFVQCPDV